MQGFGLNFNLFLVFPVPDSSLNFQLALFAQPLNCAWSILTRDLNAALGWLSGRRFLAMQLLLAFGTHALDARRCTDNRIRHSHDPFRRPISLLLEPIA